MAGLDADPFGEKSDPWWRAFFRSGASHAPRRYAGAAGALGPLAGLVVASGDGLDKPTRAALVAGLTFVPPLLVEVWWRRRKRRQDERLLILPE